MPWLSCCAEVSAAFHLGRHVHIGLPQAEYKTSEFPCVGARSC